MRFVVVDYIVIGHVPGKVDDVDCFIALDNTHTFTDGLFAGL